MDGCCKRRCWASMTWASMTECWYAVLQRLIRGQPVQFRHLLGRQMAYQGAWASWATEEQ